MSGRGAPWREAITDERTRYDVETWLWERRHVSMWPPVGWERSHERYMRGDSCRGGE